MIAWKKTQNILVIILGIAIGIGIFFLNKSKITRDYRKNRNIVDKNGILSSGTILEKKSNSKYSASSVTFYYIYNDSFFVNRDYKFADKVGVNERVLIKIDTTNPHRSYIVEPSN